VLIPEILGLRAERARLLGYENFADLQLADTMAGTEQAVQDLLAEVWEPAKRKPRPRLSVCSRPRAPRA